MLSALRNWRVWDPNLPLWYDAEYRLPLTAFGKRTGLEPRRADLVVWYLLEWHWVRRANLRTPARVRYEEAALVHTEEYLESLSRAPALARIFGVDPWDIPVDELVRTIRLGCGATLAAARESLERGGATVNLMGGFHHAGPGHGAGLCALNDMAIAVAALRKEGFAGQVVILDLDAHPPDGTAACLREDDKVWIGSLSGSSSGVIAGADETVLPPECGDAEYLDALEALLGRMPTPALAMVIAGGDVLRGDHLGHLGLTMDGVRRRDLRVARALFGLPAVWLPGGGYHEQAWQLLAGTVLALLRRTRRAINPGEDPMSSRFARLAKHLSDDRVFRHTPDLSLDDVEVELGMRARGTRHMLLGTYSAEAIEYGLYRFGLLAFLERRGYGQFRVSLGTATTGGERVSVYGQAGGVEHLLMDAVVEGRQEGTKTFLYMHWLALRDPRARFSERRPRLPGQDVPGLGLVREVSGLLVLVARQLDLAGVAFRPAHYHTAYVARSRFRFADPSRQARFEAMQRDLGGIPLAEVSRAFAEGRVLENGVPCEWEAAEMVFDATDAEEPAAGPSGEAAAFHYEIVTADAVRNGVQAV